jgi:hypothetical protein
MQKSTTRPTAPTTAPVAASGIMIGNDAGSGAIIARTTGGGATATSTVSVVSVGSTIETSRASYSIGAVPASRSVRSASATSLADFSAGAVEGPVPARVAAARMACSEYTPPTDRLLPAADTLRITSLDGAIP